MVALVHLDAEAVEFVSRLSDGFDEGFAVLPASGTGGVELGECGDTRFGVRLEDSRALPYWEVVEDALEGPMYISDLGGAIGVCMLG